MFDRRHQRRRHRPTTVSALLVPTLLLAYFLAILPGYAQTTRGEIESRAAPVARRQCIDGPNKGQLCNENQDCYGGTCFDRNLINISVAVHYDAPEPHLVEIKKIISEASEILFDITDGQMQFGRATIHNGSYALRGDFRIYGPATPLYWEANTGQWKDMGSVRVSIDQILNLSDNTAVPYASNLLTHEFVHLLLDAQDEYQSRPVGCGEEELPDFHCPALETLEQTDQPMCIMDDIHENEELCWGGGDPANAANLSGGNHDRDKETEQSRCRDGRSCWDQAVWSWPNTLKKPKPNVGPHGEVPGAATVTPMQFVFTEDTTRVVLVLDESGSMILESPKRMERLQVAAMDFVTLAGADVEVGLVSYSDDAEVGSGRVNLPITALGGDRTDWIDAVGTLSPYSRTNIGDGLLKAKQFIDAAGEVTANTAVVLMTDGINNEPWPESSAAIHLQARLDQLLMEGIPIYVTCTGSDLGLDSQCAEIAAGTEGMYVDSANPGKIPEAFVDFHERIARREAIDSVYDSLSHAEDKPFKVFVDEGSESVTFSLLWQDPSAGAEMEIVDPLGGTHPTAPMPHGRYARFVSPVSGEWQMEVQPQGSADSSIVMRAYTRNRAHSMAVGVRHATVRPGEEIYIYAYPRSLGRAISQPDETILALVTLPDGSTDRVKLADAGRKQHGSGDDVPSDGIFTGVYRNTQQKGAYTFLVRGKFDRWPQSRDRRRRDPNFRSRRFEREVRVSVAVGDPRDVEMKPEDGPRRDPRDRWLIGLSALAALLAFGWLISARRRRP